MYRVSYLLTVSTVKGEGELVELAVAQANHGAGLAYLLRARDSRATRPSDLAMAEKGVAEDRLEVAKGEAALAAARVKP